MSFAVWHSKPPFEFAEDSAEQIFRVGSVWVVTDDPARATLAEVDAVLNPPAPPSRTPTQKLAALGLSVQELRELLA